MADSAIIRIERSLDQAEPALRKAFLEMVAAMKSALTLEEIADLLETGRLEQAFGSMLTATARLGSAFNVEFVSAAQDVADQLNRGLGEIVFDFDAVNEPAVQAMRNNRLRLVSGFNQGQRRATSEALIEGITRGANPLEQARAFRDSIGLTSRQVQAVNNYRRALEEGSTDALSRELRDKRFDSSVRRAARTGDPLSRGQIDKMTNRYRDRMLAHRANTIARTEALRSVHEGQKAMFDQAVAEGSLQADNLMQEWNTALDERVRGSHASMHGQLRLYGEEFVSGKGNRTLHPGGFNIPDEDINCRCNVSVRVITLEATEGVQVEIIEA